MVDFIRAAFALPHWPLTVQMIYEEKLQDYVSRLEHFVGAPLIRSSPFFGHDHCLHPPVPPDEEPPEPVTEVWVSPACQLLPPE